MMSTTRDVPEASFQHVAPPQVSSSTPSVTSTDERGLTDRPETEEPRAAIESKDQQSLGLSKRLWDDAFDSLETEESELVESYRKILVEVLLEEKLKVIKTKEVTRTPIVKSSDVSDELKELRDEISAELKDRGKRQVHMEKLLLEGRAKIAKASKITRGISEFAEAVLMVKPMADFIIQNTPQAAPAALPWAGVCFGLQVRRALSFRRC